MSEGGESIDDIVANCRVVQVPVDMETQNFRRHFRRRRRSARAAKGAAAAASKVPPSRRFCVNLSLFGTIP